MNKDKFEIWFKEHLDEMADLKIYHHNSSGGETIRQILTIMEPIIKSYDNKLKHMKSRITRLEKEVKNVKT